MNDNILKSPSVMESIKPSDVIVSELKEAL